MALQQALGVRRWLGLLCVFAIGLLVGCGEESSPIVQTATPGGASTPPPKNALTLVFPFGSEKKPWLTAVTERFNQEQHETADGQPIFVDLRPMGSGEMTTELLDGRIQAHLASPASGAFITLGNAESQARVGGDLIGKTTNLVLSPVVIAMWKPMAEALGWPDKPLGWADILEQSASDAGWSAHGYPQWGAFKFGHTHPEYSNSGLISLIAEVYAGAGKVRGLTLDDVNRPEVAEFLAQIERSVVHYGSSTGFFGRKLFGNGPEYLSAAVLYENMVIESYDASAYTLPFPVVAIYPKEGTFWSDHPVGIVQRDWVTDAHQAAAQAYIDYLMAPAQQQEAIAFGFRPGDPAIAMASPLDTQHGVDPAQPTTTLEVPPADVMQAVIDLWQQHKKPANVVLVMDTSGSMKGDAIVQAKEGAKQLVELLHPADTLTVIGFNNAPGYAAQDVPIATGRAEALRAIDSFYAGGGTALYDAIAMATQHLARSGRTDAIDAVVVLTDGKDTRSNTALPKLIESLRIDPEATRSVRVFPIGYGGEAEADVLKAIAESTQTKSFTGDPKTIREVFKEIATFF